MNYAFVIGKCVGVYGKVGKQTIYNFELLSNRLAYDDSPIRVITSVPALTVGSLYKIRGHLEIIKYNNKRMPVIVEKEVISVEKVKTEFSKHRMLNQLYSNSVYLDSLTVVSIKKLGQQMCVRFKQETLRKNEIQVLNFFAIVAGNAKNKLDDLNVNDVVDALFIVNRNKVFDNDNDVDEIGMKVVNIRLSRKELARAKSVSESWNFKQTLNVEVN